MAYAPKITASVPCSRESLNIYDSTGQYDADTNPGGLGTPNPDIADISAAMVIITTPAADYTATGVSYPINVYPTIPTLNLSTYYPVLPTDLGMTDNISDGWYSMQLSETYNIGAGDVTVTYDYDVLITAGFQCVVNKLLVGECKCKCNPDTLALELQGMINSAYALFDCDMKYKASVVMQQIARKVATVDCGC